MLSFDLKSGYDHIKLYKNIGRNLETELWDSIHLLSNQTGKLVLVLDSLSMKDVVLENKNLRQELKVRNDKATKSDKLIDQASSQIRSAIKNDVLPTAWPAYSSNVSTAVHTPSQLRRFLLGLLTGHPENEQFKTLTGNTELIETLNKLGHGISYTRLEENDTALWLKKLATGLNERVLLPPTVKPNVLTNLAWDNIDSLEETLSEKGTSDRVNGIAVQPRVFGLDPPPDLPHQCKSKHRAIGTEDQQPELNVYIAGTRTGPHPLTTSDDYVQDANEATMADHYKNILWMLSRQRETENQDIPNWTGFNIKTRDKVSVSRDVVQYLLTINAPATELSTVFEILIQSEEIR